MLVQSTDDPARWDDPEWSGRGAATFAIAIGVSRYDHLDGGPDSYGLGQLAVSALTAYRFFVWLRDHYRHPDKPLACCWLLLAPTEQERATEPGLPVTPPPTFANCRRAIGYWFHEMKHSLHPLHLEQSRAAFFFSGHGLEVSADRQILLPSDYLEPPNRTVNTALSTYNLYTGLRALPLAEHFFFIDACRNDHEDLREMSLEGTEVLNPSPSYQARPDLKAPLVYATGPGAAAWAPRDPRHGPSIFGRALVEGLECRPGMTKEFDGRRSWVTFRGLEDFLEPRVSTLLLESGSRVKQPVRIWGPVGRLEICEVPEPAPGGPTARDTVPARAGGSPLRSTHAAPPFDASLAHGRVHFATDSSAANAVEELLSMRRSFGLDDSRWRPLAVGEGTEIGAVRRDGGAYRIDVHSSVRSAAWLELDVPETDLRLACVLPGGEGPPVYTIELELERRDTRWRVADFDVVLSRANTGLFGRAAALWSHFHATDPTSTSRHAELVEDALAAGPRFAFVAVTGALLLLRTWRHDRMRDWAQEVAAGRHASADARVIATEQLLRTRHRESPIEVVPQLLELESSGLPRTVEGLALAARQVQELLQFAYPPLARRGGDTNEVQRLHVLSTALKEAFRVLRPGGLTATFIGRRERVRPDVLQVGATTGGARRNPVS